MVTGAWHRASALVLALLALLLRPASPLPVRSISFPPVLPADRVRILLSQFTAGVRGSRAPPVASA